MNKPTDLGMHVAHDTEATPAGARAPAGGDPIDEGNGNLPPSPGPLEKAADALAEESATAEPPASPKKASRSRRGRELDTETAIGRLSDQHRELARLFKKLDREATKSGRRLVFSQVATLLATHRMLEERHFYPELREALADEGGLDEALQELEDMRRIVEDIRSVDVTDPRFNEMVLALRERVELHVEDVESTLFPRAEQALGAERLRSIGGAMSESLKDLEERARRGVEASEERPGHEEEAPPR